MKIQELLRQLIDELQRVEQAPAPQDPSELKQGAVMVPPLQQEIEISKAQAGKDSEVINQLTQSEITDNGDYSTENNSTDVLADLLKIAGVASKSQEEQPKAGNDFNTSNPAAVIVIPNNSQPGR